MEQPLKPKSFEMESFRQGKAERIHFWLAVASALVLGAALGAGVMGLVLVRVFSR